MAIFPTNPSMDGPNPDRPTTWSGFEQYTYQPMQAAQQFYVNGGYVQPQMPMYGQAESLNVGVSAAVVLYEAVRQRQSQYLPQ